MKLPWILYMLVFLITGILVFIVIPKKWRYIVLLVISLVLYFVYCKLLIIFILLSALSVYLFALLIQKSNDKTRLNAKELPKEERKIYRTKRKKIINIYIILCFIINIGTLIILKYLNFFVSIFDSDATIGRFMLPLGISYYTLQALSYIIDIKEEKYEAEKNVLKVLLFVTYFPQLSEGPFGRYNELKDSLFVNENIKKENVLSGILLILLGLFKVYVISSRIDMFTKDIFSNYQDYQNFAIIFAMIFFTIQLYTDFSGNIDIVRGISRIFGINLDNNFDLPFISKDVGEFWRRWHISLGRWFKDYVFYPISLSKFAKKIRKKMPNAFGEELTMIISLLIVWTLTGLWHGASIKYLVYGLYYFIFILISRYFDPLIQKLMEKLKLNYNSNIMSSIRIFTTLIIVGFGMLMFKCKDLSTFYSMLKSIFVFNKFNNLINNNMIEFIVLLVAIIVLIILGVLKIKKINLDEKICSSSSITQIYIIFFIFIVIVIFGAYGNGYLPPDPIYGGF